MPSDGSRLYSALRLASTLMVIQALAVIVFGVVELASHHRELGFGVGAAVFFIAYGIGIGVCGWGLLDLHRWARGPTLLIELLNLGLGWSLRGGSTWGAAVALAVPSVLVLVCVLLPASVEALEADGGREPRS
ncbi:MAG: hypothetical protein ACTHOG_07300 [Marmoricola sp.]